MNRIKLALLSISLIAGFGLFILPVDVGAAIATDACVGVKSAVCEEISKKDQFPAFVKIMVNTLLYILGAVSVIVIIVSGIFFAISGGNATTITKAKNALLYAVVGLVVAIMAYAIVNYVIALFLK